MTNVLLILLLVCATSLALGVRDARLVSEMKASCPQPPAPPSAKSVPA